LRAALPQVQAILREVKRPAGAAGEER